MCLRSFFFAKIRPWLSNPDLEKTTFAAGAQISLFSLRLFSKTIDLQRVVFGRLESQFEALPAWPFWPRYDNLVLSKSEGKIVTVILLSRRAPAG